MKELKIVLCGNIYHAERFRFLVRDGEEGIFPGWGEIFSLFLWYFLFAFLIPVGIPLFAGAASALKTPGIGLVRGAGVGLLVGLLVGLVVLLLSVGFASAFGFRVVPVLVPVGALASWWLVRLWGRRRGEGGV